MPEYTRTYAEINKDAILHNFYALKSRTPPDVKAMAVIKADAYGHGALEIAHLLEGKADYFAVATFDEALELRGGGISTPILILSYTAPSLYEKLVKNNITQTIYTLEDARALSETARALGRDAKIHISVDTGMSRIGFRPDENSAHTVLEISKLPNLEAEGIFTHYACADCAGKEDVTASQTRRFGEFCQSLCGLGLNIPIKHICNSAGIIELDEYYDMIRMGVSLYGLYPSDDVSRSSVSLKPAMRLISHVIYVKEIEAGTGVSYGHIYTAARKTRIATVCVGYADGYPRALSSKGRVIINGGFAPVVGKVCMDQIMLDVTDIPDVKVGDRVILMGEQSGMSITAQEIGEMSMSFNYEVVCGISRRVPRVYVADGEESKTVSYLV
ncbi:MAG: alanine racemase [Clostridiales bacterium]|jgi:alanine racemase|nr:alanine racemase [Clostridiales bacterium]